MILVITEKPSVAMAISRVIGARERRDGYLEGNGYLVSWCIGHLVELAPPESYDKKYGTWRQEDLPILPVEWKYEVIPETKKQFQILAKLMNSVGESEQDKNEKATLLRDNRFLVPVEKIVCATDAGREGELIFRLVYQMTGSTKPFVRLWISSMEDEAIREGFEQLRPSEMYDSLYQSALCREHADWIIGMNGTRFFSVLYGQTLNIGRVMTPTLAMIVMRDAAIRAFISEPFYIVRLDFGGFQAESVRIRDKNDAEQILSKCGRGQNAEVMDMRTKQHVVNAPPLYDLTSLQRDANRIYGYSSKQTLDYAQSLYEKKLITYPRTDSRYLTDDMADLIPQRAELLRRIFTSSTEPEQIIPSNVVNSAKVSDHHAIIPTASVQNGKLDSLPMGELSILHLLAKRFLAAISLPHVYDETTASLVVDGKVFTCKAKRTVQMGWKKHEVTAKTENAVGEDCNLSDEADANAIVISELRQSAKLSICDASIHEGKTTPPDYYTEDTLLAAMQSAGKEDAPEGVEYKGIGTPATRAGIIEKLIQKGFVKRKGSGKKRSLTATDKGISLITVMHEELQSPLMTAEWEEKLLAIERGDFDADAFMSEIQHMVTTLVKEYKPVNDAEVLMRSQDVIGKCPKCGSDVVESSKGWNCVNRSCHFIIWKDNAFFNHIGKKMTKDIALKLLAHGKVSVRNCRSQRTGKNFDADIYMTVQPDGKADYRIEFADRKQRKKP